MKASILLTLSAGLAALASASAHAQSRPMPGGPRNNFHNPSNLFSWERAHGFKGGFGGVWIVEREVPVIVERTAPAPPPTSPLKERGEKAPPRKPYVIGSTYASLPGGCMKLIEDGVSYYYCGGEEWYQQTGKLYRAVARKL